MTDPSAPSTKSASQPNAGSQTTHRPAVLRHASHLLHQCLATATRTALPQVPLYVLQPGDKILRSGRGLQKRCRLPGQELRSHRHSFTLRQDFWHHLRPESQLQRRLLRPQRLWWTEMRQARWLLLQHRIAVLLAALPARQHGQPERLRAEESCRRRGLLGRRYVRRREMLSRPRSLCQRSLSQPMYSYQRSILATAYY